MWTLILMLGGVLTLLGACFFGSSDFVTVDPHSEGPVACTMDAMMCPDGTAVGRVGPRCEFAPCPTPPETKAMLHTKIEHGAAGLNVAVTPHEVLEDSRCPADVVCIQAGTVRVRTTLESALGLLSAQVFELGKPITTEAETVTLTEVTPYPFASQSIDPAQYEFIFTVERRTDI